MSEELTVAVLEEKVPLRQELEPRICAIELTTDGRKNDLSESYDVALSVSFGADEIELEVGGETIPVGMKVRDADVSIYTSRCELDANYEPPDIREFLHKPEQSASPSGESNVKVQVGTGAVLSEAIADVKVSYEKRTDTIVSTGSSVEAKRLGPNRITLKDIGSGEAFLEGQVLHRFPGWRIKPNNKELSGILASVRVRERWIDFYDPGGELGKGKLAKFFNDM